MNLLDRKQAIEIQLNQIREEQRIIQDKLNELINREIFMVGRLNEISDIINIVSEEQEKTHEQQNNENDVVVQ